jgi:copper oxidase (laccase) domain-containing protein
MTTTTSTSRRSSREGRSLTLPQADGRAVHVRCSTVADGDFHRVRVPFPELERRRRMLVDRPWTMLDERHGLTVREVTRAGEHDGAIGDVAVTGIDDAVLGCWVGDCAPVALVGDRRFATAHAGWRGLAAGVLDIAADALAEPVRSVVLGPVIGACCYEFGEDDLVAVASGVGLPVRSIGSVTSRGTQALDLHAVVGGVADRFGAAFVVLGGCTGCSYPGYSHRVRRDRRRHMLAAWRTSGGDR